MPTPNISDVTEHVNNSITKTITWRPTLEVGELQYEAYFLLTNIYSQVGCDTQAQWATSATKRTLDVSYIYGEESYKTAYMTLFCYKSNAPKIDMTTAVQTAVDKWYESVGTYRYAGQRNAIVNGCHDENQNTFLNLDDLNKNTFLITAGKNSEKMVCAYADNTNDNAPNDVKKAQYVLCLFEAATNLTDDSVTQDVLFDDEIYYKLCRDASNPKLQQCANSHLSNCGH